MTTHSTTRDPSTSQDSASAFNLLRQYFHYPATKLGPEDFSDLTAAAAAALDSQFALLDPTDQMRREWERLLGEIRGIEQAASQETPVEIAFLGGTGAGKSTLINALLHAKLLPKGAGHAMTAAIAEVRRSSAPEFTAVIEFFNQAEWDRQREFIRAEVQDRLAPPMADDDSADQRAAAMRLSKQVEEILRDVYKLTLEDLTSPAALDRIIDPPEIRDFIRAGSTERTAASPEALAAAIRPFLENRQPYWPLVQRVRISGPFQALPSGITLVDLPGLNDPSESRIRVTEEYLTRAQFVWIVFNSKRALTKDLADTLNSRAFLRQVLLDGKLQTLTFVGTHVDDYDVDTNFDKHGIAEDAPVTAHVDAHRRTISREVREQLSSLVTNWSQAEGADSHAGRLWQSTIQDSPIFIVSARGYLQLQGLDRNKSTGLDSASDTGIPTLAAHLTHLTEQYSQEVHLRRLAQRLRLVLEEVRNRCQGILFTLQERERLSAENRLEVVRAAESAHRFLLDALAGTEETLEQNLAAGRAALVSRLDRAIQRGRTHSHYVTQSWTGLHFMTLKAVCRYGGRYMSASAGLVDLPRGLADAVIDDLVAAWEDYFGPGGLVQQTLGTASQQILHTLNEYYIDLVAGVGRLDGAGPLLDQLDRQRADTRKVMQHLAELLREEGHAESQVERQQLLPVIEYEIARQLQPALEANAHESGPGMKSRMLERLLLASRSAVAQGLDVARENLEVSHREFQDRLRVLQSEFIERARRDAGFALENLRVLDTPALSAEQGARFATVQRVASLLQPVLDPPP